MADGPPPNLRSISRETKAVIGLVSGAEFVNHTYLVLLPPILSILATDFNVSLSLLGIALGAQGAANAVFQLPFGYLSDNYDRKLSLALTLGLGSLGTFMIALAPSYPILLIGLVVVGVGVAGHHAVHLPLISEATSPGIRGRAFSMRGFAGNIGFAFPPVVMTAIIGYHGMTWRHAVGLIAVVGAVYGLAMLGVLHAYIDPDVTHPPRESTAKADHGLPLGERMANEIRSMIASPAILAISGLSFLKAMAGWGIATFTVVLLMEAYGVGFDLANLTLTAMFLAGAVMILVGGDLTDRFGPGLVIIVAFGVLGGLVVVMGSLLIPSVVAIALAIVVGGMRSIAGPARSKLADTFSPRTDLGQTFAIITVGSIIGTTLSPPILGTLIDHGEVQLAFFVIASFAFLAVILTIAIVRVFGDEPLPAVSLSVADDD